MHAAPADFAFGGEPFAVTLGDFGRFLESLRNSLGIALWVCRPIVHTGGGIDSNDPIFADAELAKFLGDATGFIDLGDEIFPFFLAAHRGAAIRRTPNRRDHRTDREI